MLAKILKIGLVSLGLSMSSVVTASVEAKYQASCATCHASGKIGAQKKGNKKQWAPVLKKGMPTLVKNVKNGYKNMPARGLCNDCSDADYEALIKYMAK